MCDTLLQWPQQFQPEMAIDKPVTCSMVRLKVGKTELLEAAAISPELDAPEIRCNLVDAQIVCGHGRFSIHP